MMKKSLKFICIVLSLLLAIAVTGCGKEAPVSSELPKSETQVEIATDKAEDLSEDNASKEENPSQIPSDFDEKSNIQSKPDNTQPSEPEVNSGKAAAPDKAEEILQEENVDKALPDTSETEQKTDVASDIPTCTLEVRCDTILKNMDKLDKSKVDYVPADGVIFVKKQVTFTDGESVFDLLLRVMRENGIHLEFESTPAYKSTYIEGIANIYEFDCGAQSGWMYMVNGKFPGKGSSGYVIKPGDEIVFMYTVEHGKDIGGYVVN